MRILAKGANNHSTWFKLVHQTTKTTFRMLWGVSHRNPWTHMMNPIRVWRKNWRPMNLLHFKIIQLLTWNRMELQPKRCWTVMKSKRSWTTWCPRLDNTCIRNPWSILFYWDHLLKSNYQNRNKLSYMLHWEWNKIAQLIRWMHSCQVRWLQIKIRLSNRSKS